jgi:DNA-binding response OmpR family regulator
MQKIYIVKFNLLYEILEEIKENFSFKIIKVENERDFLEYNDLDKENFLIISKNNSKLLKDIKGLNKNFLNFDHLPLTLKKIFEIINIKLIQLKFNHQSKIIIKDYELNLNSKFITRDNLSLKLTEKEAEIILYLNHNKIKHDVTDLQKNIWGYATNIETHTVETHIYRLRKKISNLFKDDNFILSDKNGYFIS